MCLGALAQVVPVLGSRVDWTSWRRLIRRSVGFLSRSESPRFIGGLFRSHFFVLLCSLFFVQVIKQAVVACLAKHGIPKGHPDFNDLFQTTYRGSCFALVGLSKNHEGYQILTLGLREISCVHRQWPCVWSIGSLRPMQRCTSTGQVKIIHVAIMILVGRMPVRSRDHSYIFVYMLCCDISNKGFVWYLACVHVERAKC